MGLSRNKVAVPEGAAGTPPFWSHPSKGVYCDIEESLIIYVYQSFLHIEDTQNESWVEMLKQTALRGLTIYQLTIYD